MNKISKTKLPKQTKFRLSEITGIENYFHQEINQRKLCIKKLSKYVTAFDYIDKVLIVLSATSSRVSIISFKSVVGGSSWNGRRKLYFNFFFKHRNYQKITKQNKKQEEKA